MYKYKKNKFQKSFAFLWDNKDETLDLINEYIKETKGSNWSVGRCWNEDTQKNDSDTLYISEQNGTMKSLSFYRIGNYVVDMGKYFHEFNEKELNQEKIVLEKVD